MNNEQLYEDLTLIKTLMVEKQRAETGQVTLPNILLTLAAKDTALVQAIYNLPPFPQQCCLSGGISSATQHSSPPPLRTETLLVQKCISKDDLGGLSSLSSRLAISG